MPVSFNIHKDLENHSRELLLLFKPFSYTNKIIILNFKKIAYNFNISNEEANEWDNLQQQYNKIHEING